MARIRTIKPEFTSDEQMARCSRDARLMFVYLITQADDDGLVPATPRQLLGSLYPHDPDVTAADVEHWAGELASIGAVRARQTRGGAPILEIVNWSSHQKILHRSKPILLNSLRPLSNSSRETQEGLCTNSVPDQQPATMDHGPTTDRGPATSNQQRSGVNPSDPWHARVLTAAANRAVTAKFGEQPTPYVASSGHTTAALQRFADAGVDIEFARERLADAVARLTLDRPPRSIGYFVPAIVEQWLAERAHRDATAIAPAVASARDPLHFAAVRYAREGDAEWRAYCAEKGIAWEVAA